MKTAYLSILTVLVSLALVPAEASAQSFVEYQHMYEVEDKSHSPTVDGNIQFKRGNVDMFAWFLASEEFGEALVGASKSLGRGFGGSIAGGLETDRVPVRGNGTIWHARSRFFTIFINEYGGSGYWYKLQSTARFGRVSAGLLSQKYFGTGPVVSVNIGNGFALWTSVANGPDTLVGLRRAF